MKLFKSGRREPQSETQPTRTLRSAAAALEIEELEPRLTPDYLGTGSSGGGGGAGGPGPGNPPSRSVGWGC